MGVCLYAEAGRTLRGQDLDKLFALYEQWGLAGLKPGFVQYGTEREFLRRVPTTWDDTRVLAAEIGHQLVVARRSGQVWFIGGMTGDAAADVDLPLDFLAPDRDYRATLVADDPAAMVDGTCPARMSTSTVRRGATLSLPMAKAGGAAVILDPASP